MDGRTKQAYIEFLSGITWDWFWTGTFREWTGKNGELRGRYSVDGARRAVERFFRPFTGLEVGIVFIEGGSLYGKIHVHGLLRFRPGQKPPAESISARWFDKYGYNRLESIRSPEAVAAYLVKYITKHAKDETYVIL